MHYRNHILVIASLFTAFVLFFGHDVSAASLKERMLARVPAITALKDSGVIGENNQGFLEFRKSDPSKQKLVSEENQDRKTVYSTIAKQQNIGADLVGQRRAQQLAAQGSAGQWFQKPDGSWYQK